MNRTKLFLCFLINTYLLLSSAAFSGNASITLTKPGMAVYDWEATSDAEVFLANGALRIGDGTTGTVTPVYRFEIPKVGTVSNINITIDVTEYNSFGGGTVVYVGTDSQGTISAGSWSTTYAPDNQSELLEWIEGESDTNTFADFIDIKFINTGYDDLIIYNIDVYVEYSTIPDTQTDQIAQYQQIYDIYTVLDGYNTYVGPILNDLAAYTADDIVYEGISKAYSVADALSRLNGFDISGLDPGSWGSWVLHVNDVKTSFNSAWNLWETLHDFIYSIDNAFNKAKVVTDLTGSDADLADATAPASIAVQTLASTWQSAISDGDISEAEKNNIISNIDTAIGTLNTLKSKLDIYSQDVFDGGGPLGSVGWSDPDEIEHRRGFLQLTQPLKVYENVNEPTPPDQWQYLLEDYINFLNEVKASLPDYSAPTPNPMTWATEPYETSTSSVSMVATTANDASTPISYYFNYHNSPTGGSGGTDSQWQSGTTYSDSGLGVNHQYGYRIKAKDSVGNETSYTPVSYDYTDIETPSGATFGEITSTSIQVKSSNTPSGLTRGNSGLYIDSSYGTNSGWKTNNNYWTCSNLIPNYDCSFRIKARNGDGDETGYYNSIWKYTLANKPGASAFSNIAINSIRANWTSNDNYYYTDYYCENITTGQNSGWINNTYTWNCSGLASGTNYSFRVKAKNSEGIETEWTDLGSTTTLDPSIAIDMVVIDMNDFGQDVMFDVWNDGTGVLNYEVSITEGSGYFSVSPLSGTSTDPSDKESHTIHVDRYVILPGKTVTGKVMITSSDANDSPQYIDLSARKIEFNLPGSGTKSDPYLIYTSEQFNTIGLYLDNLDKHYKLMANIDLSIFTGTKYNIIGNSLSHPFTGTFDGNSNIISNLTMASGSDCVGVFGYIVRGSVIKNLWADNINIDAQGTYVGGVVGLNEGRISNCHSTGILVGSCCGGVVGTNVGLVDHCSSSVAVTGVPYSSYGECTTGGLIGVNRGTVFNSKANGSVTGTYHQIGGLIGGNSGLVCGCFSTGLVSGESGVGGLIGKCLVSSDFVQNSYWDIESSSQSSSCGGEGKTTVQMKQMATFANWDFTNAWHIEDGVTYPILTGLLEKPEKYVDDDALGDPAHGDPNISDSLENGSIERPFDSIQEGINAANPGDTVIVMPGLYVGSGNRDISFNHKGIILTSLNPQDPNVVKNTIINSEGSNVEPHRAICLSGLHFSTDGVLNPRPTIQGFTITGGHADQGGGIYSNSFAQISNCIIRNNNANYGGGISADRAWGEWFNTSCGVRRGQPVYVPMATEITSCEIINNTAVYGGGIYGPSFWLLSNNVFENNYADYGGGISTNLTNATNNTLVGNQATFGGGIYGAGSIDNSILWGNTATNGNQVALIASTIECNYSNIEGGQTEIYIDPDSTLNWGPGNINTDPGFARLGYWDPNNTPMDPNDDFWVDGDYHLKSQVGRWGSDVKEWLYDEVTSPCIDAGDPNASWTAELWSHGKKVNMGAYGNTSEASMSLNNVGNVADFNKDDSVNLIDYSLFSNWWQSHEELLDEDMDRNNAVDLFDLALFAEQWLQGAGGP